jgi:hypothetical protein
MLAQRAENKNVVYVLVLVFDTFEIAVGYII